MLVAVNYIKTPSVERLVKLWAERYKPDLSSLSSVTDDTPFYGELIKAASPEGRALTASKLHNRLVTIKCQMAGIQTNALYSYIPNIVDLSEANRLTNFALLVYMKLLEIYQDPSPTAAEEKALISTAATTSGEGSFSSWQMLSIEAWGMPGIQEIAAGIEPILLEFQQEHILSKDWRTLGFITTLLNFSNKLLVLSQKLTPQEQLLIHPYFRFIEEQVALPWQRVCIAAAKYQVDSPTFKLVEQLFPVSQDIAQTVYSQLIQLLPNHRSRRGDLTDPGVTHSCLRDLEMFQAYLWLCLLEDNMAPIELELVDLCLMVLPGVKVKWEMIELCNKLLAEEIIARLTPSQRNLIQPYTDGLQQAFLKQRDRFALPNENTKNAKSTSTANQNSSIWQQQSIGKNPQTTGLIHGLSTMNQEIERLTKKMEELDRELAQTKEQLNQRRNQFGISQ